MKKRIRSFFMEEFNEESFSWFVFGVFILSGFILLSYLLYIYFTGNNLTLDFGACRFRALTGLYCGGCGGTRALRLLLKGHFIKAFYYHPGVAAFAGFYIIFSLSRLTALISKGKIKGMLFHPWYMLVFLLIIIIQCIIKNAVLLIWETALI